MDVVVSLLIIHVVKPRCTYISIRLGTDGRLKGASRGGGILKFGRSFSPNFSTFRATRRYSHTELAFLARALNFYLRRTSLTWWPGGQGSNSCSLRRIWREVWKSWSRMWARDSPVFKFSDPNTCIDFVYADLFWCKWSWTNALRNSGKILSFHTWCLFLPLLLTAFSPQARAFKTPKQFWIKR